MRSILIIALALCVTGAHAQSTPTKAKAALKPAAAPVAPAPEPEPAPEPAPPAAPSPAAEPRAARPLRVAVYEFKADGIEERVARIVTDSVVAELRKLQRVSVVSMDEVRAMLDHESQKQLVGCSDESCLSEIADSLGVDGLVIGQLAAFNNEHIFGMRRLDQREAQAVGQVSRRLVPADGEEFLAAIGPSVAELFPEYPLRDGQTRGVEQEAALRLSPPPIPTWAFWTAAGTAGALAISTAALGVTNVLLFQGLEQDGKESVTSTPLDGRAVSDAEDAIVGTGYAFWLSAGAVLVAGSAAGVMALFTDWAGHASEDGDQGKR